MSPVSPEEVDTRRYGGVNGNNITLTEKRTWANNKVIEFKLRNDSVHKIQLNLLFFCLTLFLGNLTDSLIIVALSAVALALHCKNITTSIDFDTLLVVESVGIQISNKKIFSGFNSSQFLPWTTVEDVFVNEVITGQRVLYFLTFLVKEFVNGEERTRLVPLFTELKPSKECLEYMYAVLASLIGDTKEFPYEDELMKVIKRIIKSQPSQGQLSTAHLSITYKHTFWTRQDKMFAMLKFRNRQGAAVFPQAFILTISLVDNPGSEIKGLLIKSDPNLKSDETSPEPPLPNSSNPADAEALSESTPRQAKDSPKFTKIVEQSYTHNLISPTTTPTDTIVCQNSFTITNSDELSNVSKSSEDTTTRWTRNKNTRSRQDTWPTSIDFNTVKRYNDGLVQGDASAKIIVDDSEKASLKDCSTADKDERGGGAEERGTQPEPISQRSSDITNQVMEGLMFTIKQVEDNVKVVEQRTKMELDEVLENSEKVETKEGQRCLVNSSLLRLENLVTKIDIPDKQLKDPKIKDSAPLIDSLAFFPKYSALDHNGFSTARCLAAQPEFEKQAGIFVSRKNRSPLISSSKSNGDNRIKDQILDDFFPPPDLLVPIELADMELADGGQNITEEFHQNLIRQEKKKFSSNEIEARDFEEPTAITSRDAEKHISESGSSSADGNDNNNNNNNNCNISNGEVHIDMWKLLQDITRGAKVMVERISDIDIRNATRSSMISVSAAKGTGRRVLTRRKK